MKEQIKAWLTIKSEVGHNNESDDQRFYDIVLASSENKIDYSVFEEALKESKTDITDSQISIIYKRYEDIMSFLHYYKKK